MASTAQRNHIRGSRKSKKAYSPILGMYLIMIWVLSMFITMYPLERFVKLIFTLIALIIYFIIPKKYSEFKKNRKRR